jgi:hypothetical protein
MTAATGMAKMAPGMPASLLPIMTEPRTTTGWSPTASAMSRGWMMFISTNQPMTMMTRTGSAASGLKKTATSTGGAHEMNGPEERDRLQDARRGGRDRHVRHAEEQARGHRDEPVDDSPSSAWPSQEAAERAGDAVLEELGFVRVGGRDEAEEEAGDPIPIDGHVQRQEEDEEQVAEDAEAGDGDVAERLGQVEAPFLRLARPAA